MTNKITLAMIVVTALALVVASPSMALAKSSQQGPQTITKSFFVSAHDATSSSFGGTGLVNTGINLVPGASVTVTAAGTAVWATGDGAGGCSAGSDASGVGPTATPDNSCGYTGPSTADSSFLAPGLTAFSLVGQVGAGNSFQLGTGPTTITGQSGTLELGFNDNFYGDNSKGYTVTVSYICYPGNGFGDTNHIHCGPSGQS